jgi:hypothetical protein
MHLLQDNFVHAEDNQCTANGEEKFCSYHAFNGADAAGAWGGHTSYMSARVSPHVEDAVEDFGGWVHPSNAAAYRLFIGPDTPADPDAWEVRHFPASEFSSDHAYSVPDAGDVFTGLRLRHKRECRRIQWERA